MTENKGHGHHHGHHNDHESTGFDHMGSFLLSEERKKWQDPEKILDIVNAPREGIMVDLGCGPGFFTLPAAVRMRGNGELIGIDASPKLLSICSQRLAESAGARADLILLELDEMIPLMDGSVDFVLLTNVLHDFQKPEMLLGEAGRVLKSGGRIANIDWKKEEREFGPPQEIRLSLEKSIDMLSSAGFRIQSTPDIGPYHYCVVAGKGHKATRRESGASAAV